MIEKSGRTPTSRSDIITSVFRWILAMFFILAGLNHFRDPATYYGMMPEWIPWPRGVNLISGTCETAGGIGLLIARFRRASGWFLIALLVAVFPANLHVALQGYMPGSSFSPRVLWLRLPFQAVFIAWVAWVAFPRGSIDRLKE